MEKLPMCRICLVQNCRMFVVVNRNLHELYEKLTDIPFVTEDSRPVLACFICCTKLKQCYRLLRQCLEAEELLAQKIKEGYEPNPSINQDNLDFYSGFIKSPIVHISIDDERQTESFVFGEETSAVCEGLDDDIELKQEQQSDELELENLDNSSLGIGDHSETDLEDDVHLSIDIKEELPFACERLDDIIEPNEEHQSDEVKLKKYSCQNVADIPLHRSESDLEDDVPLAKFKTDVDEEQKVCMKKQRASETTRATVAKKPKLDTRRPKENDTITAEQLRKDKSDSKVIRTTSHRISESDTYFEEPLLYRCLNMSGRAYLAWDMLATAANEDERRDQGNFQATLRKGLEDPLEHISDNNFTREYRLNKEAFQHLCGLLKVHTDLKSSQRVSLESKVLCALFFYAHGSYQRVTGKALHFSQKSMSMYIQEVTQALNHPNILKHFIKFPTTRQERNTIKLSFYKKYGFPGVIGCIDGNHFKIFTPKKEEEHLYFCREHYHSLNVQMICDHNCLIIYVNARFGGATHDAFIWENSNVNDYMQSLHTQNEIVWLLGDSGYPHRPWLMTPYIDPPQNSIMEIYNVAHISTRVVIKNTFERLRNRWRCLHRDKTMHYQPEKCAQIILACCVLHNIALKFNVPDPEDNTAEEPQELFERHEEVVENERTTDLLLRGRTLRDQVARRLSQAP